jgi:hypothetical protein
VYVCRTEARDARVMKDRGVDIGALRSFYVNIPCLDIKKIPRDEKNCISQGDRKRKDKRYQEDRGRRIVDCFSTW